MTNRAYIFNLPLKLIADKKRNVTLLAIALLPTSAFLRSTGPTRLIVPLLHRPPAAGCAPRHSELHAYRITVGTCRRAATAVVAIAQVVEVSTTSCTSLQPKPNEPHTAKLSSTHVAS